LEIFQTHQKMYGFKWHRYKSPQQKWSFLSFLYFYVTAYFAPNTTKFNVSYFYLFIISMWLYFVPNVCTRSGVVHFDALKTLSSMSREKLTTQLDMLSADSLQALNADLELITDAFYLGEMGWELQRLYYSTIWTGILNCMRVS